MIDLTALERDLTDAYGARLRTLRRRRRVVRSTAAVAVLAGAFAAVALASDIGGDLQLDPTKWAVLGGGSTDGGRGSYVHAQRRADGSHSTFMVEHDSGLAPYQAFLLHERTKAAADATSPVRVATEPGPLCTPEQLTRAETVALQALAPVAPGTSADATKPAVDDAVGKAFGDSPCRGLEYAGEQARLVWAGTEPRSLLMPGAR
jgi:hypothetical protein